MVALLVVVVLVLLSAATLWAFVDAQLQPESSWRTARISQGVTTAAMLFGCGLGAAYYFGRVRPRLLRAQGRR